MDIQKLGTLPPPPGVFSSLRAGFDIVTNHVVLILIPLCLDLFLWLAPRLSVSELLSPYCNLVFAQAQKSIATSDQESFIQTQAMIMERLQNYNLFSLFSKVQLSPVGISSLAAQSLPIATPFGPQTVVIISSAWVLLGLAAIFTLIGWIIGGVYFRQVARSIMGKDEEGIGFGRAIFQTILLSMVLLVGFMIIFVPLSIILSLFTLISPAVANAAVLILLFLSFWLIVPLFFSPHGIFMRRQNAFYSIYSSLWMTRFSLPSSGMFVLSAFLLSSGLNILWSAPKSNSWLALVGFAGHAFVTTVLLAASFVYYRDMNNWLVNIYEPFRQTGKMPSSPV